MADRQIQMWVVGDAMPQGIADASANVARPFYPLHSKGSEIVQVPTVNVPRVQFAAKVQFRIL